MSDPVAIVTGGSSGIGLWTARDLACAGHRIGLVCRDRARAESARELVQKEAPGAWVDVWLADLSSARAVRGLVRELRAAYAEIDVLVNNAGAVFGKRLLSAEGVEMHLATNYVGHFLLTTGLLDRLIAAGSGRVLSLTSSLHAIGRVRFDDGSFARWYHLVPAYAQSKLAVVLFTQELARRTAHLGLQVACVDPGFVRTGIARGAGPLQRQFARPLAWFGIPPQRASAWIARLASERRPGEASGGYYTRGRRRRPGRRARGPVAAAWWEHSRRWLEPREAESLDALLAR